MRFCIWFRGRCQGVKFYLLWGWDMLLREEAAKQLSLLVAAAWSEGHELTVASAYRSFYDQVFAYSYYSAAYGGEADRISAPPGHSEHQLGTTVDFTNAEVGYEILQDFGGDERLTLAPGAHRGLRACHVLSERRGGGDRLHMGAVALPVRRGGEGPRHRRERRFSDGLYTRERRQTGPRINPA